MSSVVQALNHLKAQGFSSKELDPANLNLKLERELEPEAAKSTKHSKVDRIRNKCVSFVGTLCASLGNVASEIRDIL